MPQTELVVDCGSVEEPPLLPATSSSSSEMRQQLGNDGVGGCVEPCDNEPVTEPGATVPAAAAAAAGGIGSAKDDEDDVDGKVDRVYSCPRCEKEFRDETSYQKHCRKCCDD